jgi:hypothetical protein
VPNSPDCRSRAPDGAGPREAAWRVGNCPRNLVCHGFMASRIRTWRFRIRIAGTNEEKPHQGVESLCVTRDNTIMVIQLRSPLPTKKALNHERWGGNDRRHNVPRGCGRLVRVPNPSRAGGDTAGSSTVCRNARGSHCRDCPGGRRPEDQNLGRWADLRAGEDEPELFCERHSKRWHANSFSSGSAATQFPLQQVRVSAQREWRFAGYGRRANASRPYRPLRPGTIEETAGAMPARYNSPSELDAEITPGENQVSFDLKSK